MRQQGKARFAEAVAVLWATVAAQLLWPTMAGVLQPAAEVDRPLPRFVNVRSPQDYVGAVAISSTTTSSHVNVSFDIRLYLYSVVPDVVDAQVYLLFEFVSFEWHPIRTLVFSNCTGHYCPTDVLPHLRERSFGDLRCEFVAPDGRVLAETPTAPVVAREMDMAAMTTVNTFVGQCAMPEQFRKMVAKQDDYNGTNLPRVRVLRQGDVGAGPNAIATTGAGAFARHDGWMCLNHAQAAHEGDRSAAACADWCYEKHANDTIGCFSWHWLATTKKCYTTNHMPVLEACERHTGWVGAIRRHVAWDQVDTQRKRKRLISFGLGMPLFGDSSYMLRVPQWLECVVACVDGVDTVACCCRECVAGREVQRGGAVSADLPELTAWPVVARGTCT
jgi:hypothetical protein